MNGSSLDRWFWGDRTANFDFVEDNTVQRALCFHLGPEWVYGGGFKLRGYDIFGSLRNRPYTLSEKGWEETDLFHFIQRYPLELGSRLVPFKNTILVCCQSAKVGHFETREDYRYEECRGELLEGPVIASSPFDRLDLHLLVSWFGCVTITSLRWIGVRQTGFSLVMEDRQEARVAAPLPNRARTVAWANGARILQGRADNSQEVLMEQEAIYVGIDVAKAQLDVAVRPTDDRWEVSHDDAGVRQLVSRLKAIEPAMVLLEAALAAHSVPVVVVNPRQVRDFARATGKLAKTDALDAAVLAHFAEAVRPPVRPLRDT